MTMFKARANPSGNRPKARTAVRFLDREVASWCVLGADFTVLLIAVVLAHIGS